VSPLFCAQSIMAAIDYLLVCIMHLFIPTFLRPISQTPCSSHFLPPLQNQLQQGDYRLALGLLIYYAYRSVYPTKEWAFVRNIYRAGNRYFYPQEVLFDGFKDIKPDSRSLICMHPHGILTIGWALTSTSPTMTHANVKWLVTEALLRLPFIR